MFKPKTIKKVMHKKGGNKLITLTIKNKEKEKVTINHKKIEKIEEQNDTIVFMESGAKIRVEESVEEITQKIIKFEASILREANILEKRGNKDVRKI